jgi:hypothetical protein
MGGNVSQRDQSHVNIRHEVLDWFGPSSGVIVIRLVLMYYAIKIGSSLFLSRSFGNVLWGLLNVDLSSLFIVREPPHRV